MVSPEALHKAERAAREFRACALPSHGYACIARKFIQPAVVRGALLLLLGLLFAFPATAGDEEAHQRVFSAGSIMPAGLPTASLSIGFTQHYRGAVPHAAFAFAQGADGRAVWAMSSGHATPSDAEAEAMDICGQQLRRLRTPLETGCRLLATDGTLHHGATIPVERGSVGPFRRSPFHLHRGAAQAAGVLVWGHGYGGPDEDYRGKPLPGFLTALNEAGFDILRFDRHPGDDSLFISQPRLVRGLPALRAQGYRQVILGGESRGAWQALMAAAERPELVDAVLAAAPAAHGEMEENETRADALADFQRLLSGMAATPVRLLVVTFEGDEFDPDPAVRAQLVAGLASQRAAPTLALFPSGPARGHSGARDWRFTRDYGACVLTLLRAPEPAAPRGLRRRSCGGG
jgi:pimeloyl-ACP methyl ester carboxylesterase